MSERAVELVMLAVFLAIVVWDIWLAFFDKRKGNTISERMRALPTGPTLLAAMGLGLLAGHWWWR